MIYLDNAATTKPDGECLERAATYLKENFYNPSALYAEGYKLHKEVDSARSKIVSFIANPSEFDLIFTSCGTEADNHALLSFAKRGNFVTTLGEHSAIYSTSAALKERGIEVRYAQLNPDGSVNEESLMQLVDENTSLVSIIHVNNETGAINDINALARLAKAKNPRVTFHSDGVQAFGKISFRLSKFIDLYSISAHKINAVKGTGALIKKKSLFIKPLIYGGGQENGLRSGTENVFGIKMLEFAAEKHYNFLTENFDKVSKLNNLMREKLDSRLFKVISSKNSSPYILCVAAKVRGEIILHEVNDLGLIIGTGSACSSNAKNRYSRVILSCGVDKETADGIVRLSFSAENSTKDVCKAAEILNKTVELRKKIMD